MKQFNSILLAASSLIWSVTAVAASRPHYGGSLHVMVRESPQALDPATMAAAGAGNISRLIFETLVGLDERGRPQALLATSWESEPGNQRWRFLLRHGVYFHDGTALDAAAVVASLRNSNPEWKLMAAGDTVVIESEVPDPDVPAECALAQHGIVHRTGGQLSGTGPFVIAQSLPGKHLTLNANVEYREGRPFIDSIEVEFAKNDRDQITALDLGKADVAEVAAENIRRAGAEGRTIISSEPTELMALVFSSEPQSDDELHARNALAFAVDTSAINNVVLQGGGEPTAALLPTWLSGYGFVFSSAGSRERAMQEVALARHFPALTLGYEVSDPVAHVIAERILLNARDAGALIQPAALSTSGLRLVRIPLSSPDPHVALTEISKSLQLPKPRFGSSSVADLYSAEKELLQSHRVIPLLHLRGAVALRPIVQGWRSAPDGSWQLTTVWLSAERP